eukprot:6199674-Pleurochrysis_carterae.AAC.1
MQARTEGCSHIINDLHDMKRTIVIKASSYAGIAGMNPYQHLHSEKEAIRRQILHGFKAEREFRACSQLVKHAKPVDIIDAAT